MQLEIALKQTQQMQHKNKDDVANGKQEYTKIKESLTPCELTSAN